MAAMHAESFFEGHPDIDDPKTRQSPTALDEFTANIYDFILRKSAKRCSSFCMKREADCADTTPISNLQWSPLNASLGKLASRLQLLELAEQPPPPYGTPPPTYLEAALDAPPDYSSSETLAQARPLLQDAPQTIPKTHRSQFHTTLDLFQSMTPPKVDFGDASTFTTHTSKKKLKAAEKAENKSKWGEEGNSNGGDGEAGGANDGGDTGGGGDGGDNNGSGGAGAGGDGGDDNAWDDWGASKKKKKGKKTKAGVDEEEEKRKREEEEAEAKKKAGEAASGDMGASLDWADDAIANADDDYGFTAAKPKKSKKAKNALDSSVADKPVTNNFDEINLLDDYAPKIDLSFGDTSAKETSSSGFAFGGSTWGSGWKSSSNDWNFDAADTNTTDATESKASKTTKQTTGSSENTWSFGGIKGNKKKTTVPGGLDFGDLGALDEDEDTKLKDEDPTENGAGNDWNTFTSVNKNDKKKKKGDTDDKPKTTAPVIDVLSEITDPNDTWSAWGPKKDKDKKRGKNEPDSSPLAEVVEVVEAAAEDDWMTSGAKKEKKKAGKKAIVPETSKLDETPIAAVVPEPVDDTGWGTFGTKAGKGKGSKKTKVEEVKVAEKIEEKPEELMTVAEPEPEPDFAWGLPKSKKEPKKGKIEEAAAKASDKKNAPVKATWDTWDTEAKTGKVKAKDKKAADSPFEFEVDPIKSVEPAAEADDASAGADDNWMDWEQGKKSKKKTGTTKEAKVDELVPPPPPPAPVAPKIPETSKADTSPKSAKDKRSKKGKALDVEPAVVVVPEILSETQDDPLEEDLNSWDTLPPKEKRKKEKEKEKAVAAAEKAEAEAERLEEEKWLEEERLKEEAKKAEADKKKSGKKGTGTASKTKDLLAGSVADTTAVAEEVTTWGVSSIWGSKPSSKDKKKTASKAMDWEVPPAAPTPPAMGLTPEPEEEPEDDWGASFSAVKTKGKKDTKTTGLTRTTSTSKGLDAKDSKMTAKGSPDKSLDLISDFGDFVTDTKPKEETPAKAVKSFWSSMGGGTSKAKTAKEKEKEAREEAEAKAREDADLEAYMNNFEDPDPISSPPKSGSKVKADSKLTRTNSKGSDKAGKVDKKRGESDALVDIVEESSPEVKESKAKGKSGDDKEVKTDAFSSIWGGTKKTGVKKGDESKEISKASSANQKSSAKAASKEPEAAEADEAVESKQPLKTSKMSTAKASLPLSKTAGALSVAEKIKAFEKDKGKKSEAKETPPAPPAAPQPQPKDDKPKLSRTPTSSSKKKDLSPSTTRDDPKKSLGDSVPGSFPSEGADDDIIDIIDFGATDKKSKTAKVKGAKVKNDFSMAAMIVEAPIPPTGPPTPPPEPVSKTAKKDRARVVRDEGASSWGFWGSAPKKDAVKERKAKDDADISPPSSKKAVAPGLSRSKSTRTPKEKEKEDVSKSSGSDKDKGVELRPVARTRGTGLSSLFGASPARAKSTRRTSTTAAPKTSSRRESMAVGGSGMPSPPLDDAPEMTDKAAKLMGMGAGKLSRKESTKGKQKSKGTYRSNPVQVRKRRTDGATVVPDPYAIDDDDMVMVNGLDDPVINAPPPKKSSKDPPRDKLSRSKSKREASPQRVYPLPDETPLPDRTKSAKDIPTKANGKSRKQPRYAPDDDIVMVEAGPSTDGPDVVTGPDDIGFVEKSHIPPPLKRSATSAKKSEGSKGLFGLFGKARRNSDTADRPKSKATYGDEDGSSRRKRTGVGGDDDAKRARRDDRKSRQSTRPDVDADASFVTDAGPTANATTEAEDAEARREARRAKRAEKEQAAKDERRDARRAELKELEEKKARRQLSDKAATEERKAKIREMMEKKARGGQAKESRKLGKTVDGADGEEVLKEEDEAPRDLDPLPAERRSKHRSSRNVDDFTSRPKSDRRRSHMDGPLQPRTADDEAERRSRRDDRRSRRTPTERPSASRRKSAPVQDYFDPRNASHATGDPYPTTTGGNDHTSSWVKSQISDPPELPPIEPTVIEQPPLGDGIRGDGIRGDDDDDEIRRSKRKSSRRRSKYLDAAPDEADEKRRRRERREKELSSEGSAGDRHARRRSENPGARAANVEVGSKRASWFKKITNL
ncbi:hypothetical protein MMC13_004633 [Lambiella insularis]|nr:hypothetical protein [Lambiella insularis]